MIGIHSPEFEFEKKRSQVEKVANRYHMDYPIVMDNDFRYWKALGNRYWPSFYLVDRNGKIIFQAEGEMHQGQKISGKFERLIQESL